MRIILLLFSIFALAMPVQPQISNDASGRSYTRILGLELEKMTFPDVFVKLGPAKCYESGDAGDYDKRTHYYLKNNKAFLTFSSGEIDGGVRISVLKLSIVQPKEQFTVNATVKLLPEDIGGIRMGMTGEQLFKSIPASAILDKSKPEYDRYTFKEKKPDTFIVFENVIPMTGQGSQQQKITDPKYQVWHELIMIVPVFRNGKLIEITISKTTDG